MSKKKRDLTEDEKALWRRVARSVKLRRPGGEEPPAPAPASTSSSKPPQGSGPDPKRRPNQSAEGSARAAAKKTPAPPANRGADKRVRRGKVEIGATLDLHGYTQDGAYLALATFLQNAQRRGAREVLVVTGVGRMGEGVLRQRLPEWLAARELKPLVSGYAQAHRGHGGAGAFYVFLKRAR